MLRNDSGVMKTHFCHFGRIYLRNVYSWGTPPENTWMQACTLIVSYLQPNSAVRYRSLSSIF